MRKKSAQSKVKKVNKTFMTSYLKCLFLLTFSVICAIFITHHMSLAEIKAAMIVDPGNTELHMSILQEESYNFYKLMIATMVCFFIAVCILTADLAKQVSQPVEELMKHFDKVPHLSQVKKIRYKKGSTFSELMQSFNFMVQRQGPQVSQAAVHNYRKILD